MWCGVKVTLPEYEHASQLKFLTQIAFKAVKMLSPSTIMLNKRIVVLGAGVSGLTTATLLLQQEKGIKVHLIAKYFPGDLSGEYTSLWAGAHWLSRATKDEIRQQ
ncbi:23567_t:CDS:2, partial [Dentiscutata erythropus]